MNGSVRRDPNGTSWGYVFDGPRHADGRRRQIKKRGFASKRAADQAMREHITAIEAEASLTGSSERLVDFLGTYVDGLFGLAPSTRSTYLTLISTHVAGTALADAPLVSITAMDIEKLLSEAKARKGRGGRTLSAKSLRNLFTFLRSAFTHAVDTSRIPVSPMAGLKPPQVRNDPSEMKIWTDREARAFLRSINGSSDQTIGWIASVALLTGMRRGELLGLRWSDVDLERHTLSIANTRTNVDGKAIEGPPKTARSRRSLKLSAAHVQVLNSVAQRQDQLRSLFGENYVDSGLVFTDDHGRPLEPDSVSKRFQKAVAAAGFTVIRFHDLRHTHASIAINGGEHIKAVSARLGHADIGFTLRQYTHLMPEHQGLPADGVADALFGAQDSCDQTCDQSVEGMQKAPSGKGA